MPDDRADDVRLHERLLAGDDDALAEAYDRWSTLVHSLAIRITADHAAAQDVTQEVFVHLWEHPDRYDPHRGTLRSWLCLLARGRAIDSVRRSSAQARRHTAAAALAPMPAEVDDGVIWQAVAKVIREAVAALPDPQREAVLLAYYQGRTYRQVACDLGIPEGTAKWRLRAALGRVAEFLTAEGILER